MDDCGCLVGGYTYTLTGERTHSGSEDESLLLEIPLSVTDSGQTTTNDTLTVRVEDDRPQAAADTSKITEDALTNQVTGNVMTGESTGDQADTQGADGAQVSGVQAGSVAPGDHVADGNLSTAITGQYGRLVLQPDGSYSYQLDNSNSAVNALKDGDTLEDVFSYTITDNDGDPSDLTLTITINGHTDGEPAVTIADNNGAEVGDHSIAEDATNPVSGTFSISAPDGLKGVTVNGETLSVSDLEALNTTPRSITGSEGTLTLTGYDASTGEIRYEYQQTGTSKDHSAGDDSVIDRFIVTVTDNADVESDPESLDILITDTAPVANADANTIAEDTIEVTGNVIGGTGVSTGDVADTEGADGATVTGITSSNVAGNTATENAGTLVIEGEYGTLTINPDGNYRYELNNSNLDIQGLSESEILTESFTYTLTDQDGDTSDATLTLTVTGTDDAVTVAVPDDQAATMPDGNVGDQVVFESGLADGSAPNTTNTVVQSSFTIQSLDGLATSEALTFTYTNANGDSRTLSLSKAQVETLGSAAQVVDTQYGELALNGYSQAADGTLTIDYEYTLERAPTVNAEDVTDSIQIQANDRDGDSDSATLGIKIVDDAPVADDDSANVTEGRTLEVEGVNGVLANDKAGADGWNPGGAVIGVAAGTVVGEVSGNVATAITGTYGTLILNADGSYTYVANPDSTDSDVEDVFTYTVVDSDGDHSTATLTINVADVTEPPVNTDGSVSEAGLPTGTDASTDSELISNASLDLQDGWSVVTAQSGSTAFGNWSVATDGTFNYTLTERADHSGSAPTDSFTYEAQDAFGNTVINTVTIAITDDEPSIEVEAGQLGSVTVDESALGVAVTDTDFIADVFDINHGADGEQSTSYRLEVIDGNAAGVTDVGSGTGIFLFMDGDDVVGRVGNSDSGDIAFRISIDASSGAVTLTQSRPLQHPDMDDPNDELRLTDAAVRLIANAVDGDNDSVDSDAVNIGGRFIFLDDGPDITAPPADASVDEANLALGSNPDVPATTVTGSLNVDFGADGAGDVQFTASGDANTIAGLQTQGWQSQGEELSYVLSAGGHTLTAYRGDPVENNTVFVVEITNPTTSPGYSFTLTGALDHLDEDTATESLDLLFEHIRVTDRDGDWVETGFTITVVDDDPSTEPKAIEVVEDSTEDNGENTFNTNADATGDNTSIGDGTGGTVAPSHGTATVNPNGTITYVPNLNFSGTDSFTYTTTTDNETKTFTVVVTVTPVADAPEFEVVSNSVVTNEDESIALGLKTPKVTDDTREDDATADFPERLGEITLSGIPEGAKLLDGLDGDAELWLSNGEPVTVVLTDGPTFINGVTGELNLSVAQFEALKVLPPEHDADNFIVTSRVESYEVDAAGNPLTSIDSAETVVSVAVEVVAVTDPVTLSIVGVEEGTFSTTIDEDTSFDLAAVLSASFADLDGSEQRQLVIEGLPQGSVVNGITIGASGSISIPAPGLSESTDDFPAISIRPPQDFSGDITDIKVTLRAVDTDGDTDLDALGSNPGVEESEVTLNIFVNPVAGDIAVDDVTTPEDTAIAFLQHLRVTDNAPGEEIITEVSFGVPTEGGEWTIAKPDSGEGSNWSVAESGGSYT